MASDAGTDYLHLIDTNTAGSRCDVTPLFGDGDAFASLLADLERQLAGIPFDVVAGIDALGFILGAALAVRAGKGFIPIRKAGKLPVAADRETFVDYSGQAKGLELRRGALAAGRRVLPADEWIETGEQVRGAVRLIERQRATVAAVVAIHVDVNDRTRELLATYPCFTAQRDGADDDDRCAGAPPPATPGRALLQRPGCSAPRPPREVDFERHFLEQVRHPRDHGVERQLQRLPSVTWKGCCAVCRPARVTMEVTEFWRVTRRSAAGALHGGDAP